MHLQLFVPDLFWAHDAPGQAHAELALPCIETMVARGRKRITPTGSLEAWLLSSFGIKTEVSLPVAPFALAGHGMQHEGRHWICIDPVHLRVERDDFTLQDASTFPLDQTETAALMESLNGHFRDRGYRFVAPSPAQWYLSCSAPLTATTVPLQLACGQAVDALRPTGEGAMGLQALVNEVQMLLHDHPVNVRREQRGVSVINSVWPWGSGTSQPVTQPRLTELYANAPLARGLGHAVDIAVHGLPEGLANLPSEERPPRIIWVVLDQLRRPSAYRNREDWRDGLAKLEKHWFTPALEDLRQRKLGMLTIHAIGATSTLTIESTAMDLRYFWRRRKNLSAYIATPISGARS